MPQSCTVSFAIKCAKLNVCVCCFLNIHFVKSGDQNGVAEWNLQGVQGAYLYGEAWNGQQWLDAKTPAFNLVYP